MTNQERSELIAALRQMRAAISGGYSIPVLLSGPIGSGKALDGAIEVLEREQALADTVDEVAAKGIDEMACKLHAGQFGGFTVPDGEDTCPKCGADTELDEDRQFNADGAERTPWTCPECGAEGVQVREIIFTGHESVKTPEDFAAIAKAALYPDGPRTMYNGDGTLEFKAIGGGCGKWGPQISREEAARLVTEYEAESPEDIGIQIYCREASDVPGLWAGIEAGDLDGGKLPESWETFEVEIGDGPHAFER